LPSSISISVRNMAITILTGIEDTLALILECGNDLARIEAKLLPALRKLCSTTSADAESSRNAPSSSRNQQPAASERALCAPIQGDVDPLSALDPAVHSLGMLYLLSARATHDAASPEKATILLPHISAFVQRFDPQQVRLAGDKVAQLAETFTKMGDSITNPESALQLLQALATRFWTRSESLTALHPILAYVSISMAARLYAQRLTPILLIPL
jgi:COP9 signalosome complex subunit 3